MKTSNIQSLVKSAQTGDAKAFAEIVESVRATFNMLVARNVQAFKAPYERDDYVADFQTKVWNVLYDYDENKGSLFNTYFYNRIQWELSNMKAVLKKGRFEMPFSGLQLGEDTDAVDRFEESICNVDEVEFGKEGDIQVILERAKKMSPEESFFIESIFNGCKIKEVVDTMVENYGYSRQWCYHLGDTAVNKLKNYVKQK